MVQYGLVWSGMVAWSGLHGLVQFDMIWFGFVGIVWYGGGSHDQ